MADAFVYTFEHFGFILTVFTACKHGNMVQIEVGLYAIYMQLYGSQTE